VAEDNKDLKTDIALIKSDIKQIEKFFNRFEAAIETMSNIGQKVAVQSEILKNTADKLDDMEDRIENHKKEDIARAAVMTDRLEQYRLSSKEDHQRLSDLSAQNREKRNQEIMTELSKLNGNLERKMDSLSSRIGKLENWKYYMMGLGAAVLFIVIKFIVPTITIT
jgi:hypothetical protein